MQVPEQGPDAGPILIETFELLCRAGRRFRVLIFTRLQPRLGRFEGRFQEFGIFLLRGAGFGAVSFRRLLRGQDAVDLASQLHGQLLPDFLFAIEVRLERNDARLGGVHRPDLEGHVPDRYQATNRLLKFVRTKPVPDGGTNFGIPFAPAQRLARGTIHETDVRLGNPTRGSVILGKFPRLLAAAECDDRHFVGAQPSLNGRRLQQNRRNQRELFPHLKVPV